MSRYDAIVAEDAQLAIRSNETINFLAFDRFHPLDRERLLRAHYDTPSDGPRP